MLYSFSFHCLCPILVFIHHNKLGFYQFPKEHKSTKSIFPRVIWLLGSISLQIRFTIYYISKILCILLIVVRIVIGTFFIIRICVMYFHGTYSPESRLLLLFFFIIIIFFSFSSMRILLILFNTYKYHIVKLSHCDSDFVSDSISDLILLFNPIFNHLFIDLFWFILFCLSWCCRLNAQRLTRLDHQLWELGTVISFIDHENEKSNKNGSVLIGNHKLRRCWMQELNWIEL